MLVNARGSAPVVRELDVVYYYDRNATRAAPNDANYHILCEHSGILEVTDWLRAAGLSPPPAKRRASLLLS